MSNVNTARAFSGVYNDRISYPTPPVWGAEAWAMAT